MKPRLAHQRRLIYTKRWCDILTDGHTCNVSSEKVVVFLPWDTIEPEAQQQILNTAKMPFVFKHVAVMPDCHYGKGATVGTVLRDEGGHHPGRRRRGYWLRHDRRPNTLEALGHS